MASSSARNWVYDVFPSFSGEDVRITFLSHFLKELDRKLIIAFKDNEIERSRSLDPELRQAIKDSRIAVVIFSKKYASSSWCLNELLEIVKCKEEFGQMVIPVFYGLDPSHVRKQTDDFGKIFAETCHNKTEEVKIRWSEALTNVANILGYHSVTWGNEAKMIENISNDVIDKLLLTPSKDCEQFVGIEDHIAKMSVLLQLESEEVRMVGLWGSSGIGKTTIARTLFDRLCRHFQGSIFIDRAFLSKSMEIYSKANPDDYNMKLHLQRNFLSEILGKRHVKINHLSAVGERLKNQRVLIFIDDLDDQVVLDALVGQTQWFGSGSRIIVVTNDKHFLRAHGIDQIYEVCLPSEDLALEMLCQFAFKKKSPPEGFDQELIAEVARHAGSLPLGLSVLGSSLRGRDKKYWMDLLPRLQNGIDGKIEKALRVSYDGLGSEEDKVIFRYIACYFSGAEVTYMKLLLADYGFCVDIALGNLADKSLIGVRWGHVEMHRLLQEMGKTVVRLQEPEKREFLVDSQDICDVLKEGIGTQKVIGITLDIDEIDELHVHKNAFKGMRNLRFLEISSNDYMLRKADKLYLPESFDHLPPKLKLLCWRGYPMQCMPSNFRPESLVKFIMRDSKLEKLWEGVVSLPCLKNMDLSRSHNLKEIPNLSKATNLETLELGYCYSLVELPSSIPHPNKLNTLGMEYCGNLETISNRINLKSLHWLNLSGCSRIRTFPQISTNILHFFIDETAIEEFPSNLRLENLRQLSILKCKKLWEGVQGRQSLMMILYWVQRHTPLMAMLSPSLVWLCISDISSLVELPSSFQNLHQLETLKIANCINLKTLPTGMNFQSLMFLNFSGCSQLSTFPDISTNIYVLTLVNTAIKEIPWWIEKFSMLEDLYMNGCNKLENVNLNISKLKHLLKVDFSDCKALTGASWSDSPTSVVNHVSSRVDIRFTNCFNLDQEAMYQQKTYLHHQVRFLGEEVPPYFTHRTTGTSSLNINLLHTSSSQPFFSFRVCAVFTCEYMSGVVRGGTIFVKCHFKGSFWNSFDSFSQPLDFWEDMEIHEKGSHLFVMDYHVPLNEDNAPVSELSYDHVDMQISFSHTKVYEEENKNDCFLKLKGWGIRLLEDCSLVDNQIGNPNTLPHVCEDDEDNVINEAGHSSEECGSDDVVTEKSSKRMRGRFKKLFTFFAFKTQDT